MKPNYPSSFLVGISAFLIAFSPAQARLISLSSIENANIDGQAQQHITVTCGTRSKKPTLVRNTQSNEWCDSQLDDVCSRDKIRAGQKVCSASYHSRLKAAQINTAQPTTVAVNQPETELKSEPSIDVAGLRKEALEIEDALLKIQEKRIALRQKELKLQQQRPSR